MADENQTNETNETNEIKNGLQDVLGDELFTQVKEKIGDKKLIINDGTYLPRTELNKKNEIIKSYEQNLTDLNQELETIRKNNKDNQDLLKTIDELNSKINESNEKRELAELNSELKLTAIEYKAIDINDVLKFIDYDSIKNAEDKKTAIIEQFNTLKENKSYFFKSENDGINNTVLNAQQKQNINNLSERDKYNELKEQYRKTPTKELLKQIFLQKQKL